MSRTAWSMAPYTVHINRDPVRVLTSATREGAVVINWSLRGIRDRRELDASAAKVFAFPYPSASIPGIIDFASDLEWLGVDEDHGVVFVIDASGARPKVVLDVARMLPFIGDRFRSGGTAFEAFLVGVSDVDAVVDALEVQNARLDEFGLLPWSRSDTFRVPVDAPESAPVPVTSPRRHPILRWSRRGA